MANPTYRAGPFDYGKYGPADDEYGVQGILDDIFEKTHTAELGNGFVVYSKTVRLNRKGDTKTIYLYFPNTEHTLTHGGRSSVTQAELAKAHIGSYSSPDGKWGEWFRGVMSDTETNVFEMLESSIKAMLGKEIVKARRHYRAVLNKPSVRAALKKQEEKIASATARVNELTKTRTMIESQIREIRNTDYHHLADRSGIVAMKEYSAFITKARLADKERMKVLKRALEDTKDAIRNARSEAASLRREEREMRPMMAKRYAGEEIDNMLEDIDSKLERVTPNSKAEKDLVAVRRAIQRPFSMGFSADKAVEKAAKSARDTLYDCLIGHKAPPLAPRTIRNRKSRGIEDETPLHETGEFADSLMWEVK